MALAACLLRKFLGVDADRENGGAGLAHDPDTNDALVDRRARDPA